MYKEDTIAAVATPSGEGGVAIVRVSGPDAERIANEVFCRGGGRNGALRSHVLHHGIIRDPKAGAVLDEVLLTIMRKPRSYTGEDVVEVHCHGGPVLVRQVLEIFLARGARHAVAGEFTKRAFLNGRLDLAQAEAVLDLVRSRTSKGASLALGQVRGELSSWINELRDRLLTILVQVEAATDFPDEELELLGRPQLGAQIAALREKVDCLVHSYEWGRIYRDGARVCIAGKPNVGKSSLLNALLGEERVIVTPEPGTTRDVVEESLNLAGVPITLWDTAGIRDTDHMIEKIGVGYSLQRIERADAVMVVVDGSQPLTAEDRAIIAASEAKKNLVAINKSDLTRVLTVGELMDWGVSKAVYVSALQASGLEELKAAIRGLVLDCPIEPEVVLTNARHKAALERASDSLRTALFTCDQTLPPELIAVDLQDAKEALEEIVGLISSDNILERIFAEFCIGK